MYIYIYIYIYKHYLCLVGRRATPIIVATSTNIGAQSACSSQ